MQEEVNLIGDLHCELIRDLHSMWQRALGEIGFVGGLRVSGPLGHSTQIRSSMRVALVSRAVHQCLTSLANSWLMLIVQIFIGPHMLEVFHSLEQFLRLGRS